MVARLAPRLHLPSSTCSWQHGDMASLAASPSGEGAGGMRGGCWAKKGVEDSEESLS